MPGAPQGQAHRAGESALPPVSLPHAPRGTAPTLQPHNNVAENSASLFRVAVKVPPFWADRPALWFAQIEAQFALAGITVDETKFFHVISHLDQQAAAEVEDVITNPPKENKFVTLKTEIIRRLSVSQEQKEKQLLMHEELGSRKPSQFLRHLLHLAGPNKLPESFIRTVWTSRLPINLQTIVASHPDMPLAKLSELADNIHDIASPSFRIAEVSPTAAHPPLSSATPSTSSALTPYTAPQLYSPMETMSLQIAELSRQMAALTNHVFGERSRSQARSPHRGNYRARSKSSTRSQERNGVCWYHRRFGALATRCTRPCEYKPEN